MEGFYGCKPQCVWEEEEDLPGLNAVAANTLSAVVSAKRCAIPPAPFPSHFTALWSIPCKWRGVEIARDLERPVSVPVVKAKSCLPFCTSACRMFSQQLPDVPGSGECCVQVASKHLFHTKEAPMPVSVWCPSGHWSLCFRVEEPVLFRLTTCSGCTVPLGHWMRMGNTLAALLFLLVSFSSFLSCSCIIFCSLTPCGMNKIK